MKAGQYDAIIVGARVSGAATGLLLALSGARVVIVDRDVEIRDTLSTHALMRPAVELLSDWGLLGRLQDAGTPIVRAANFQYGADRITVSVKSSDAVPGLCAPRRWLLDRTILDAAVAAGADLSLGTAVEACLTGTADRVVGVSVRRPDGTSRPVHADLVIGADGRTSQVAQMVGAALLASSPHRAATVYGYFPGIPDQGYRWYFGPGVTGGAIPTNDGLHCVFASCRPEDYKRRFATDAHAGLSGIIGQFDPDLADCMNAAPTERLLRFPGAPGHIRARAGRGWALVGDAASFKDPATAHGITDALLDAHHLSGLLGCDGGLERYRRERHVHAVDLFETTQRIASFDWDFDALMALHETLNDCLKREQTAIGSSTPDGTAERSWSIRYVPHGQAVSGARPNPRHGLQSPAMPGVQSAGIAESGIHAQRASAGNPTSSGQVGD